jgi:hypothetical protein
MDWRCGSSGRVPALQAQSPEFKPKNFFKKREVKRYQLQKHLEEKPGTGGSSLQS